MKKEEEKEIAFISKMLEIQGQSGPLRQTALLIQELLNPA